MNVGSRGARRIWLLATVLASWTAVTPAWAVQDAQLATGSRQLWFDTVRQVEAGQLEAATARIEELERLGPDGARMAGWIRDWQQMEQTRREMTRQ